MLAHATGSRTLRGPCKLPLRRAWGGASQGPSPPSKSPAVRGTGVPRENAGAGAHRPRSRARASSSAGPEAGREPTRKGLTRRGREASAGLGGLGRLRAFVLALGKLSTTADAPQLARRSGRRWGAARRGRSSGGKKTETAGIAASRRWSQVSQGPGKSPPGCAPSRTWIGRLVTPRALVASRRQTLQAERRGPRECLRNAPAPEPTRASPRSLARAIAPDAVRWLRAFSAAVTSEPRETRSYRPSARWRWSLEPRRNAHVSGRELTILRGRQAAGRDWPFASTTHVARSPLPTEPTGDATPRTRSRTTSLARTTHTTGAATTTRGDGTAPRDEEQRRRPGSAEPVGTYTPRGFFS